MRRGRKRSLVRAAEAPELMLGFLLLTFPVLLLFLLAWFAPGFLYREEPLRRCDAAILFLGPGDQNRMVEARQLLAEGYARFLVVPYTGEVFAARQGSLQRIAGDPARAGFLFPARKAARYRTFYENTHAEALEAKRIMAGLGLRSALLVSSGYHMRRISFIAARVFDGSYAIFCTPARWEPPFEPSDWLNRERRRIILSEYVKIAWFLLYGVLGGP
ncbi:YdcF family protein [Geomesophilobacter sediminis]|uniref:YdcF family protein n=1 Tax=Geomesophilobacter sediminis TaxID=2798584 RepID=A0A8J7LU56_9BACT|nr:YdcF family protein [Geomesophilobacter sediminis]MBJ6724259.1 YdcF family protein [Geomesophilobacter sediminis]